MSDKYFGRAPYREKITSQPLVGNAVQTTFSLKFDPGGVNGILVFIDGVHQIAGEAYTVVDRNLIFTEPPPLTASITVTFLGKVGLTIPPINDVGAVGGGNDKIFWENDTIMTTNYTITAGKNAVVAGPLLIADGVELTIPDGSTVTIV